jgi:hypothetical protein
MTEEIKAQQKLLKEFLASISYYEYPAAHSKSILNSF